MVPTASGAPVLPLLGAPCRMGWIVGRFFRDLQYVIGAFRYWDIRPGRTANAAAALDGIGGAIRRRSRDLSDVRPGAHRAGIGAWSSGGDIRFCIKLPMSNRSNSAAAHWPT
ncbi:hypothetical protein PT2222_10522 [Paraburkholderia tropica]